MSYLPSSAKRERRNTRTRRSEALATQPNRRNKIKPPRAPPSDWLYNSTNMISLPTLLRAILSGLLAAIAPRAVRARRRALLPVCPNANLGDANLADIHLMDERLARALQCFEDLYNLWRTNALPPGEIRTAETRTPRAHPPSPRIASGHAHAALNPPSPQAESRPSAAPRTRRISPRPAVAQASSRALHQRPPTPIPKFSRARTPGRRTSILFHLQNNQANPPRRPSPGTAAGRRQ